MTTISAKKIAHSRAPNGSELATFMCRYPRWIHAEGRTHRLLAAAEPEFLPGWPALKKREVKELAVDLAKRLGEEALDEMLREGRTPSLMEDTSLSRNASSSRAIPVKRMIEDVTTDPAIPLFWGANQKGMQAAEELNADVVIRMELNTAEGQVFPIELTKSREAAWLQARDMMVLIAEAFANAGYHKQLVNRLLEPFSHITVLVTGSQWENFFKLRIHDDAEPHIRLLAERIKAELEASEPRDLRPGDWHIPYINGGYMPREWETATKETNLVLSVGCAASVSYTTVDGHPMTTEAATRIYAKLTTDPLHASPFEHQAMATGGAGILGRNFGPQWAQHRALVETGVLGEFL